MKNYFQRPRTLVTGGAGSLGAHLCERLLNGGHDVTFPFYVEVMRSITWFVSPYRFIISTTRCKKG